MDKLYQRFQELTKEFVQCGFLIEETDIEIRMNSKGEGCVVNVGNNDYLFSTRTNKVVCWTTPEEGEKLLWECWAVTKKGEPVPFMWLWL